MTMTSRMNNHTPIFISYASEDVQLAKCIESFLKNAFPGKLEVFIDVKIGPGELWQNQISQELDKAKIFILLISNSSVRSINVATEVATIATKCLRIEHDKPIWAEAKDTGILFLPIILEDIDAIFACIKQNIQCQDFRNPYDLYAQLNELGKIVHNYLNKNSVCKLECGKQEDTQYIKAFNQIPLELSNNDYRKSQFVARVLRSPTKQLLSEPSRKLDIFFDLDDMSNILLAPYTISHKEKDTKEEVWVVSENFNNDLYDEIISASVLENMRNRGITYCYFVRKYKEAWLNKKLSKKLPIELQKNYKIIAISDDALLPFEELAIYDPENQARRWGYAQMTYEGLKKNQIVCVLCPSQPLDECVELLKSCYPNTEITPDDHNKNTSDEDKTNHEDDKPEKDLLKEFLTKYIDDPCSNKSIMGFQVGKKNSETTKLARYFSDTKNNQSNEVGTLAEYIAHHMMAREPLNLRINYNLYNEEQALIQALRLMWRNTVIDANIAADYHKSSSTEFFNNFIGKINDINSIKNAQDSLVDLEVISSQEREAREEVMIVSPLLHNDLFEEEVQDSIINNVEAIIKGNKELHYHYFYFHTIQKECGHKKLKGRDGDLYNLRRKRHSEMYGEQIKSVLKRSQGKRANSRNADQWYKYIFQFCRIPHMQVILPFNELIIFDPNDNQSNWGYMLLNYGDKRTEKIAMKLPQRVLTKLCNTLINYKEKYVTH